jgi:hypothetical protein
MVACACHQSYTGGHRQRTVAKADPGQPKAKSARGMAQVVVCLPNKCGALSSDPSIAKSINKVYGRTAQNL